MATDYDTPRKTDDDVDSDSLEELKARRNDSEVAADTNATDSTTVQVAYTPRGLVVPR
mgnify:CR=1 FL=1